MADTLLTPLNDGFLDFGTLASVDPMTQEITETGHYAAMVAIARRQRRSFDHSHIDWLVIRNRHSFRRLVDGSLDKLAMRLGFRPLDGCAERIFYLRSAVDASVLAPDSKYVGPLTWSRTLINSRVVLSYVNRAAPRKTSAASLDLVVTLAWAITFAEPSSRNSPCHGG